MFVPKGFALLVSCVVLLSVQSSHGDEIVNGDEVVPHSLPYMALVWGEDTLCGGTLISPSWVLTAAHCHTKVKVWLGVHNIKNPEKDTRQYRGIAKEIIHPNYDTSTHDNDLMLIKLDEEVRETKTVKPLRLGATMKEPAVGTKCLVAGWGVTNNIVKEVSNVLMSAKVSIAERVKCFFITPFVTENMICAGSDGDNNADTCEGDSGGPLVCNGALVGVTSFGPAECGLPGIPGVYAFLNTKNLNWIKRMMKKF